MTTTSNEKEIYEKVKHEYLLMDAERELFTYLTGEELEEQDAVAVLSEKTGEIYTEDTYVSLLEKIGSLYEKIFDLETAPRTAWRSAMARLGIQSA